MDKGIPLFNLLFNDYKLYIILKKFKFLGVNGHDEVTTKHMYPSHILKMITI